MTDHPEDLSFLTSLSLDSYSNIFDKNQHNFTTSSEINYDDEEIDKNPLSTIDDNRTFIKETSKTIINIFTGKVISLNPWRKLCSKSIPQQTDVPIEIISHTSLNNKLIKRQSQRDTICNQQAIDINQIFDEKEYQTSIDISRYKTKKNRLKDLINNTSLSSSDEDIKEHSKINHTDSLWRKLTDVYTSEESDEKNQSLSLHRNISIRVKYNDSNSSSSSIKQDNTKIYTNFLESLSENVPIEDKHPDAKLFFIPSDFKLKENRQELINKLFIIYNQDIFSNQLLDKVNIVWSSRLTATAGHCTSRRTTRTAVITLSFKICDTPERCRDTLLHEMCHAAVTLIDDVMEHGHGPLWYQWKRIAEQCYPYLPLISIRHTYDVMYKFIYRCVNCHYKIYRHSKSIKIQSDFCEKCTGKFELIINDNNQKISRQQNIIDIPHFDKLKI